MFLHCVSKNTAQVQVPWSQYREHGNSLFLFRILLGIISFVVIVLSIIPSVLCGIAMAKGIGEPMPIVGLVLGVLATISLIIMFTFTVIP